MIDDTGAQGRTLADLRLMERLLRVADQLATDPRWRHECAEVKAVAVVISAPRVDTVEQWEDRMNTVANIIHEECFRSEDDDSRCERAAGRIDQIYREAPRVDLEALKREVSRILGDALSGRSAEYRLGSYIQWGLVEKDIHAAISTALTSPAPSAAEPKHKIHFGVCAECGNDEFEGHAVGCANEPSAAREQRISEVEPPQCPRCPPTWSEYMELQWVCENCGQRISKADPPSAAPVAAEGPVAQLVHDAMGLAVKYGLDHWITLGAKKAIAALLRPQEPTPADLVRALAQAALWFEEYAATPYGKGDKAKQHRNQARAYYCRAALRTASEKGEG